MGGQARGRRRGGRTLELLRETATVTRTALAEPGTKAGGWRSAKGTRGQWPGNPHRKGQVPGAGVCKVSLPNWDPQGQRIKRGLTHPLPKGVKKLLACWL